MNALVKRKFFQNATAFHVKTFQSNRQKEGLHLWGYGRVEGKNQNWKGTRGVRVEREDKRKGWFGEQRAA